MAGEVTFEAPGGPRLVATLDRAQKDILDMDAATTAAGSIVAGAARGRVPVVSGTLRSTISARVADNSVTIGVGTVYGGVIHWGWAAHNIRANPFLTTAAEETERQWTAAYEAEVIQVVHSVKAD